MPSGSVRRLLQPRGGQEEGRRACSKSWSKDDDGNYFDGAIV